MRNLYIHIGQPKTGTSSIQRFLVENREILRDAGLGIGPYMTQQDGKSRSLRKAIRTRGLAQIMAELARDPAENVVISSEHLYDPMSDRATAEAFREAARQHFNPVILLFLRRQDYWQHSLYAQEVKTCYAAPITRFDADYGFDYDYNAALLQLEAVFGRENVRVTIYRDGEANDVIGGFLATVGALALRERVRTIARHNTTLHRRKLLFLAKVPKPDPAIQDLAGLMTAVVERTEAIAPRRPILAVAPTSARAGGAVCREQPGAGRTPRPGGSRAVHPHASGRSGLGAAAADFAPGDPCGPPRGASSHQPAPSAPPLRGAHVRQGREPLFQDALTRPCPPRQIFDQTPWSRRSTSVHQSDRGVPYLSIKYRERLTGAGIAPSVGSGATTTPSPKRSTASTRPR